MREQIRALGLTPERIQQILEHYELAGSLIKTLAGIGLANPGVVREKQHELAAQISALKQIPGTLKSHEDRLVVGRVIKSLESSRDAAVKKVMHRMAKARGRAANAKPRPARKAVLR
ncbi:MAG: hypothetical protein AABW99_05335 [archaeon]